MLPLSLLVLGLAGVGKTFFTKAFSELLDSYGETTCLVNLDPAVIEVPYDPDVDIREYVSYESVIREYQLGPNGALILSCDMISEHLSKLVSDIGAFNADYIVIDTPGQMELFIMREISSEVVSSLSRMSRIIGVFLVSAPALMKVDSLLTSLVMSKIAEFRLNIPVYTIINKTDLLSEADRRRITHLLSSYEELREAVLSQVLESSDRYKTIAMSFLRLLEETGLPYPLTEVSAMDGRGLEALYSTLDQAYFK